MKITVKQKQTGKVLRFSLFQFSQANEQTACFSARLERLGCL